MNAILICAALLAWPEPTKEMKPWAYNWWMGSAVDEAGIEYQCKEMAAKGFGGFHVIPIYGAVGWETKYKKLLSPEWVEAWNMAAKTARANGLDVDLTMGSGWCFGGPWVTKELAGTKGMKVKRAGLGGEGFMIDPFSTEAMTLHVAQFDPIFGKNGTAERPRAFYHDSYEYYGSMPKPGQDIDEAQLDCFKVWTGWCRENGYLTRNEAHGAPSNWIDFYAIADIPETEMFGKKDRSILVSKFASSAAHLKGTTLASSETCTWVDEHFQERPAEIKMFIDRLFLAGVNHIFYHGTCYSPVEAPWPGWCFYASLEMNPRNPIWREAGALNAYITRCQSIFQTSKPDFDLLVRWPLEDYRNAAEENRGKQMSVHAVDWFYGQKIGHLARWLWERGYQFDYISDRMIATRGTEGYVEMVDPSKDERPAKARPAPFGEKLNGLMCLRLKHQGETMYFVVNQSGKERVVFAGEEFQVMDPMTGKIASAKVLRIPDWHSFFVVGDVDYRVKLAHDYDREAGLKREDRHAIAGAWTIEGIVGGPELLKSRTLEKLESWTAFDEFFSGTALYKTEFDLPGGVKYGRLDLGDVREIARVRLNGVDLGVRFMKPYVFDLPPVLKEHGNRLEVEVTNLGGNRLRYLDLNGIEWKNFHNKPPVAAVDYRPLDAANYPVLPSGLLGPVSLMP